MNDRELITGLDACRAASDDLRQPEMRAVAESIAADARAAAIRVRIEHIDAAALRAMHNVPLPEGFESRLVALLHEAAQDAAIGDAIGADVSLPPVVPRSSRRDSSFSRRKWLAWSAAAATAAAATIAAIMLFRSERPLQREDLDWSREWHEKITASDDWQTIDATQLEEHLLPSELRSVPLRYRDASSVVGREAYAYDLTLPGGPQATLFVIPQTARAGVPTSVPSRPQSTTLGLTVAYWQRGDVIYVVVIDSDRIEDYRRLLRTTAPMAA